MRKVAIVTDTTACIPREQVVKYEIVVVPVQLIIENKTYRDGVDISAGELYPPSKCKKNAFDFQFITDTVAVCIVQAVAVTVVVLFRILTTIYAGIRGGLIVVAGCFVLATHDLKFITDTVAVCIIQAVAVAVVVLFRILTGAIIDGCVRIVVTRIGIHTTQDILDPLITWSSF